VSSPPSGPTGRRVAILGGGNLGRALALGWVRAGAVAPAELTVTRRTVARIADLEEYGIAVSADNPGAVAGSDTVILAVQPAHFQELAGVIAEVLDPARHVVVSVITGVGLAALRAALGPAAATAVRAMPNTPASIGEGMTCLSVAARSPSTPSPAPGAVGRTESDGADGALAEARRLFDAVGRTLVIDEAMMASATALSACGVAFFLRCIRAASQGGIEIGFHPEEAFLLAAQTARGAAALLLQDGSAHPESEIDRVTTPRGCTIAGLNEMEHKGLSSALIRGIVTSARKAEGLGE
jgi:pyrroline-5-carboxylate reductase